MKQPERETIELYVSATARLALWLAGDIEPEGIVYVENDLDLLYDMCIAVERKAREAFPDWK